MKERTGANASNEEEMLVFIPLGVEHQFRNTGNEKLKFIWIFSPQRMEEKIRKKYKE